jgi:alpha-L-fucosidase 2
MAAACRSALDAAQRPYRELRARHIADYRRIFDRSDLTFTSGPDPLASTPTDQRLACIKQGSDEDFLLVSD